MDVIWKDIKGYEGKYQVSNIGEVRSFAKRNNGGYLKGGLCGKPGPYRYIKLIGAGGRSDIQQFYVHRLVAEYFIDNPHNYNEVNHKDGNTLNNNADNLEWCTHLYNMHHAISNGLIDITHEFECGAKHPKAKAVIQKTKSGEFVKEWGSVNQIQRETDYLASEIFKCCKHYEHHKSAYGYLWEYKYGETNNN